MLRFTVAAAAAALAAVPASASSLFVSFDNFTYSGTVTAPDGSTHAIQTATNGPRQTRENARDGNVFVASGAAGKYADDIAFASTAWYFTNVTPFITNGWGNPNNTNNGFFQYYHENLAADGVTVSGGWSAGTTVFTLNVSGGNGDAFNLARLWNAPALGGPSGDTAGAFQSFSLTLVATFAGAASFNPVTGWHEQSVMPTSVTGSIVGTFLNDSTTNPAANGLYSFAFTINGPGSWADDVGAFWNSETNPIFVDSFWAAPVPIPEPATWAMLILGFGLVGSALRRRQAVLPA